ncbi:MAG: hypothetical protein HYR94_14560, partial [Chloroflexi bacterium]|nr:hypothetical protein [Chloroflexota bacterium]
RQTQQGGKTLGSKLNRAYIHVLTAAILEEAKIPVQQKLDEVLADVFSKMVRDGFRPNRFVFPQYLEGKLVQQKIIIRDNDIQNPHYVGKTITGQDAFWAEEMPGDMAFIFDSTAGITLSSKSRFYIAELGPFLPGVCGVVRLNPIVKNRKGVIALMGIEQALGDKAAKVATPAKAQVTETYVDPKRITELKAIASSHFDLTRLIEYCDELNKCYAGECYLAVAMLSRAILDHVPPIFQFNSFTEVANNYGGRGDKSLKESFQHLDKAVRQIADFHLHRQIRNKETLPNRTQVDFRNSLDMLLAEIVRVLK